MITINVYKNNILTNQASFNTEAEADSWLNLCLKTKCFGEPNTYTIKVIYEDEVA